MADFVGADRGLKRLGLRTLGEIDVLDSQGVFSFQNVLFVINKPKYEALGGPHSWPSSTRSTHC